MQTFLGEGTILNQGKLHIVSFERNPLKTSIQHDNSMEPIGPITDPDGFLVNADFRGPKPKSAVKKFYYNRRECCEKNLVVAKRTAFGKIVIQFTATNAMARWVMAIIARVVLAS